MSGFNVAISGIRAASSALDVTGNNIANASTTGFKSSRTEFADIYATSQVGSGSNVPGSGVLVSDIAQDFSGGTVTFTNNNLDLSIDGPGFFQLDDGNGNVSYTRDGSFELDKDGFVVSKGGVNLQGFDVNEQGVRLPISDLRIEEKTSPPKATEEMALSFNIDEADNAERLSDQYSRTDAGSYTFSTTVGTFDSLGNEHTIRYDLVEQQARKEVHTFDDPAAAITVSGVPLDSSDLAQFAPATNNSLRDTNPNLLADLQANDPRIFDVKLVAASGSTPDTIQVIFKAEASEDGDLTVVDAALNPLLNEEITYISSAETQSFTIPDGNVADGSFDENLEFSVAGVAFSLSGTVADPLTKEDVANEIIAQITNIRDSNPNIDSIAYNSVTQQLNVTFAADSGDVGDTSLDVEQIAGNFFGGLAGSGTVGDISPTDVVQGDNSYQGVYRMYAFLNPLGQEPEALNIGKLVDPTSTTTPTATEIGPIIVKFNPSNGVLSEINGVIASTLDGAIAPPITIINADPADSSTIITLDLTDTTQFADDQIVNSTSQDGFTKGDLIGVSFDSNGELVASFTNNQNTTIGILALATFENQAGLQPNGDNQWITTNASGNPILNPPGTGLNGGLRSSSLESSNVDLSAELVKLIEFQRNFQASSQTLETLNTVTQNILQI